MSIFRNPFKFRGGIGHQEQGFYDVQDINRNLQIDLTGKHYTAMGFVNHLSHKIGITNNKMQMQRILLPKGETLHNHLKEEDHVFKYKVSLYGRTWR